MRSTPGHLDSGLEYVPTDHHGYTEAIKWTKWGSRREEYFPERTFKPVAKITKDRLANGL
jgi:hypothetical protein